MLIILTLSTIKDIIIKTYFGGYCANKEQLIPLGNGGLVYKSTVTFSVFDVLCAVSFDLNQSKRKKLFIPVFVANFVYISPHPPGLDSSGFILLNVSKLKLLKYNSPVFSIGTDSEKRGVSELIRLKGYILTKSDFSSI